jgi:hypothetical protein
MSSPTPPRDVPNEPPPPPPPPPAKASAPAGPNATLAIIVFLAVGAVLVYVMGWGR